MVLWIVIGLVAGSLLVLAYAAARTVGRLPELRRALRGAQARRADAEKTQALVADMQATVGLLQARATRTAEDIAALRSERG